MVRTSDIGLLKTEIRSTRDSSIRSQLRADLYYLQWIESKDNKFLGLLIDLASSGDTASRFKAHMLAGEIFFSRALLSEALDHFNQALAIDGTSADAALNAATCAVGLSRPTEARVLLGKSQGNSSSRVMYLLAEISFQEGHRSDAVNICIGAFLKERSADGLKNLIGYVSDPEELFRVVSCDPVLNAILTDKDLYCGFIRKSIQLRSVDSLRIIVDGLSEIEQNLLPLWLRIDLNDLLGNDSIAISLARVGVVSHDVQTRLHSAKHLWKTGHIFDLPSSFQAETMHLIESSPADRHREGALSVEPFSLLFFIDNANLLKIMVSLATPKLTNAVQHRPVKLTSLARSRLGNRRVALLSADFRDHPIGQLVSPVVEILKNDTFEYHILATAEDSSQYNARIRSSDAHYLPLINQSDDDIKRMVKDLRIDILLDLTGYTAGSKSLLLTERLAPIQINFLGYPGTGSVNAYDYILADSYLIPEGCERLYNEKVLRLETCYQPRELYQRFRSELRRKFKSSGSVVLAHFNKLSKITPEVLLVWKQALSSFPDTRFLLFAKTELDFHRFLSVNAEYLGGVLNQFEYMQPLARDDHFARYYDVNLAVDSYPYGGHTTTSDALAMGCPVLTISGECFQSRVSASILHHCGLDELIASNLDDYREKLFGYLQNPGALDELSDRVIQSHATSDFWRPSAFLAAFERQLSSI